MWWSAKIIWVFWIILSNSVRRRCRTLPVNSRGKIGRLVRFIKTRILEISSVLVETILIDRTRLVSTVRAGMIRVVWRRWKPWRSWKPERAVVRTIKITMVRPLFVSSEVVVFAWKKASMLKARASNASFFRVRKEVGLRSIVGKVSVRRSLSSLLNFRKSRNRRERNLFRRIPSSVLTENCPWSSLLNYLKLLRKGVSKFLSLVKKRNPNKRFRKLSRSGVWLLMRIIYDQTN